MAYAAAHLAQIVQELQGVTEFVAWDTVCTEFESLKFVQQEENMFKFYHGEI